MSAADCPQDTPVLCRAHSDMPEHTTETGFAPARVGLTSEGRGAVGLCVLTPDEKQEAQLMLTTGSTRLAVSRGQQNMVPFHMLYIVSYCAIVTLSLRRAVFTIFVFKKIHDLEMGSKVTQGH